MLLYISHVFECFTTLSVQRTTKIAKVSGRYFKFALLNQVNLTEMFTHRSHVLIRVTLAKVAKNAHLTLVAEVTLSDLFPFTFWSLT